LQAERSFPIGGSVIASGEMIDIPEALWTLK
jgi:hypothetical protein